MTPIHVEMHWFEYIFPISLGLVMLIYLAFMIFVVDQSAKARAKWHAQFRNGVYEYQEHENGTRRAVRISSGIGAIDEEWIEAGKDIVIKPNVNP